MRKRHSLFIFLFIIFLLFSFFRFYGLSKRVIFDWDQERDAFIIKEILTKKKLTLIGPRVLGPEGFFLGPYFTYLLTPFYFLTGLHPKAIILFIAVYGLAFFILASLILGRLFKKPIALVFLLIWSLHPSLIAIDTLTWNPIFVPLVVIGIWYLLSQSQWFLVGLLLGLGVNLHFQMIFLLVFCLTFLFFEKRKTILKKLTGFLIGFIVPFLPLLAFDLRHDFLNWRLLVDFISKRGESINGLAWLPVWQNVAINFIGRNVPFLSLGFYFLPLVIAFFLFLKERDRYKQKFFLATIILWLVFPLGFALFGQRPSEYYFNFLQPFLVLLLANFLLKVIRSSPLVLLLVFLFFFFRADQLKEKLRPNPLGLFYKERVVQRIADLGQGKKFNVSFSIPLGLDNSYRYLLEFYQVKQTEDPDDPLLRIVVPPEREPVSEVFGGIGLFIPENFEN